MPSPTRARGLPPCPSPRFYTDNDTFAAFAVFASVHAALGPYRLQLMQTAASTGLPLVRHMWLQFPNDPAAFNLTGQVRLCARAVCAWGLPSLLQARVRWGTGHRWWEAFQSALAHL